MVGKAPWPANNGALLAARLKALGLPALKAEGSVQHTHEHIDIVVNGRLLVVPQYIGINFNDQFLAELHTHDASGIIHVESPTIRLFTLADFFGVWGLRFTPSCLGGYCTKGSKRIWVWVNAKRFRGDPRKIALLSHREIVVAYGTFASVPKPLPQTFPFPPGY